eukprot:2470925-Prymnesium_polylepis.3
MQSCSSEFVANDSKPKMSTAPIKQRPSPPPRSASLMAPTMRSKSRAKRARASALIDVRAASAVSGFDIQSRPTLMLCVVIAVRSDAASHRSKA